MKTFTATLLNGPGTIALTFQAKTASEVIEQIWAQYGISAFIVSVTETAAETEPTTETATETATAEGEAK